MLKTKILEREWSVDETELPPASLAFLLQYGFKQYLADGAAVSKEDDDGNLKTDEEMLEEKLSGIQKRLGNVVEGDFSRTVSRDPFDSECRRVGMQMLRDACKAKKIKFPDGKANKAAREKLFADLQTSPAWELVEEKARRNITEAAALAAVVIINP